MALLRALVVDDQPRMRMCIEAVLIACGFDCVFAATGIEALLHASTTGIDLIVTDIDMPQMDGWELLGLIARGVFGLTAPPVVVCSSLVGEEQTEARLAEMNYVGVPKPFAASDMVAAIDRAFRLKESCD